MASTISMYDYLPVESSPADFRDLVFDRQRAFMVMELARVRDTLMSSEALIAKTKAEPSLNIDNALLKLFDFSPATGKLVLGRLLQYVGAVAWGNAASIRAGHLPAVTPFAPEEPTCACPGAGCGCRHLSLPVLQKDMIRVLKAQPKPDWQSFLDFYIESQKVRGKTAFDLRSDLTAALEKLSDKFFDSLKNPLQGLGYPHNELALVFGGQELSDLLNTVEPLPEKLAQGVRTSEIRAYSVEQLDELRSRGQSLRDAVVPRIRETGNERFKAAATQSGQWAENSLLLADELWLSVSSAGGFESALAIGNISALAIQQKRYGEAVAYIDAIFAQTSTLEKKEPADYATIRWSIATQFATGHIPDVPAQAQRFRSFEETKAWGKLYFKSACRLCRAHIGLCYEMLRGTMTQQTVERARKCLSLAIRDHGWAIKTCPLETPASLKADLDRLEADLRKRCDQYARTGR